jgi:predicted transcriptional regulator
MKRFIVCVLNADHQNVYAKSNRKMIFLAWMREKYVEEKYKNSLIRSSEWIDITVSRATSYTRAIRESRKYSSRARSGRLRTFYPTMNEQQQQNNRKPTI